MSITPDDRPQREHLMDPTAPEGQTMGATDTREQQMPSTGSHRGRNLAYIAGCLVAAVSAAAVGLVLLTGGSDDEPTAAPSASAPTTSSPTPAPVISTPPKQEDVAVAEAKARYEQYLTVINRVAQEGFKSSRPYDTVTVAPQRTTQELELRRSAGQVQTGDTKIASLSVSAVDLTPVPGGYPKVVLRACVDVSGVDVLDAAGRSVVTATRKDRARSDVTMYRYAKGTPGAEAGGWFVYEATSKAEPC